ncbi:MAG: hypothetical protein PHW90_00645 [Bacilli bacterium]|nr:hypothetical protein [Bacilli bacterium]
MEEIKIINLIQAKRYIKNGVMPIRLEISKYTAKPTYDDDVLVFVFNKEDTVEVWEKWKCRTLV